MNRYIIVGPARSGTTVTHLCLAGHPNVSALSDEVKVDPFFTEGIRVFTYGNESEEEHRKGYLALFDALCSLNIPSEMLLAWGFKTAISSREEAGQFVRAVQKFFPEHKIILILRRDIVAQFGSLERARVTGKWHSWIKAERKLAGKLTIDEKQLLAHAVIYLQTVRRLKSLHKSHKVFEISYEKDILPGDLQVYHRLFRFLNLPEMEITWLRSRKVAPEPEEFIVDYSRHVATIRELRQNFKANPGRYKGSPDRIERVGILRQVRRKIFRV